MTVAEKTKVTTFTEFKTKVRKHCKECYLKHLSDETLDAYLLAEDEWLKEQYGLGGADDPSGVAFGLGMMYEPKR